MKKLFTLILSIFAVSAVMAQSAKTTVSGKIVDTAGEPLIGVSVIVPGASSAVGTATEVDGTFTLAVPANTSEIEISYIGYKTLVLAVDKGKDTRMGQITMEMDSQMLEDVVVTQSVAVQRKTPVAVSSVDVAYIEEKLGGQEFPQVLKTTPGVWATNDGGGFGDSKINMRGFKSENIAVMINGVPVNDMEWGGVYWSNWAGLSEVTRSMQTQRGLGASKVSAPSVGGTINIVTKSLDAKAGGSISYGIGNDMAQSVSFNVSTGVTKNGWALTVLGSRRWGDGYIQGTAYEAYTYFVNVSKRLTDRHQLSLTAFGAPQWHDQRSNANGLTIEGWQTVAKKYMGAEKSPYRYNPTFGYDRYGNPMNASHNVYHKPQISLNHQWQIDDNQSLSTAVYASVSTGYGWGGQGRDGYSYTWTYGASNGRVNELFRNADGSFDYGAVQKINEESTNGSKMILSKSGNSHQWYGLLSTYTNHLSDKWELSGGIDFRYYVGQHTNRIIDLLDGAYYMDTSSRGGSNMQAANNAAAADPTWQYEKLGVGDIVYRDYDGHVVQEGVFAQMEYSTARLSAFVSGSLSNTSYWRYDRFYYDPDHARSGTYHFLGGTAKGGVNYNIDLRNNVFANVGFISRAPFLSKGVFINQETSNLANPGAINEKIFSVEVGYGYHTSAIALNVNAYYTLWLDKSMARSIPMGGDDRAIINLDGVDAQHMGIEVDMKAHATPWLDINAMLSWGDWRWNSISSGFWYSGNGEALADASGTLASLTGVTKWTPEIESKYGISEADFKPHAQSSVDLKGVRVGGSAQTTASLGLTFKPMKGLRVGVDWLVAARNYADYSFSGSDLVVGKTFTISSPWEIPWGHQFDFSANYAFKIGKLRATIYGNINNVLNNHYIVDAYDGSTHTWDSAYRVFYAFGRTYTVRLKVAF